MGHIQIEKILKSRFKSYYHEKVLKTCFSLIIKIMKSFILNNNSAEDNINI